MRKPRDDKSRLVGCLAVFTDKTQGDTVSTRATVNPEVILSRAWKVGVSVSSPSPTGLVGKLLKTPSSLRFDTKRSGCPSPGLLPSGWSSRTNPFHPSTGYVWLVASSKTSRERSTPKRVIDPGPALSKPVS